MTIQRMPLLAVDTLKSSTGMMGLPIRAGTTEFDNDIAAMILATTELFEKHLDREFTYGDRVQFYTPARAIHIGYDFFGSGNESGIVVSGRKQRFVIKGIPVDLTGATSFRVDYDPSRQFTDNSCLVDPSYYTVDGDTGELWAWFATERYPQSVRITYSSGYTPDSNGVLQNIDSMLAQAVKIQVRFMWVKLSADNLGFGEDRQRSATRASYAQKFLASSGVTPEAAALIRHLKVLAVGRN